MKLSDRIGLIPRNNWDYGFSALAMAFANAFNHSARPSNVEAVFGQTPVWTSSGRASLYAILKSLELPAGAKVGVPLFCCSVVFDAICQAGLTPLFIDSNVEDPNLSCEDFCAKRASLAAVIAVHMFGNPCDMQAVMAVAGGIPVIEDCAQSIFSAYHGKQTGFLSTASFFSFRCGKYLSAGEGSAIFCRAPELRAKIEKVVDTFESWSRPEMLIDALFTFAKAALYHRPLYGLVGYPVGIRLDKKLNLTAKEGFRTAKIASTHLALIDARIGDFQTKIERQKQHAHTLLNTITPGVLGLPSDDDGCCANWFQFALRFQSARERDAMAGYLLRHGIDTAKYLDDIAEEARSNYGYNGDCPNAELLSKTILLVPIYYTLQSRDIERIAHTINAGLKTIGATGR
ncbi:MAG: DegT/DnrJ/EryC1/StrS family aminotransferase [Anaerolineales bacterium]|nr:DegT/DnrJ/EryC1/StrS family aminotransferase [Anaerolineales bacterium]